MRSAMTARGVGQVFDEGWEDVGESRGGTQVQDRSRRSFVPTEDPLADAFAGKMSLTSIAAASAVGAKWLQKTREGKPSPSNAMAQYSAQLDRDEEELFGRQERDASHPHPPAPRLSAAAGKSQTFTPADLLSLGVGECQRDGTSSTKNNKKTHQSTELKIMSTPSRPSSVQWAAFTPTPLQHAPSHHDPRHRDNYGTAVDNIAHDMADEATTIQEQSLSASQLVHLLAIKQTKETLSKSNRRSAPAATPKRGKRAKQVLPCDLTTESERKHLPEWVRAKEIVAMRNEGPSGAWLASSCRRDLPSFLETQGGALNKRMQRRRNNITNEGKSPNPIKRFFQSLFAKSKKHTEQHHQQPAQVISASTPSNAPPVTVYVPNGPTPGNFVVYQKRHIV